MGVGVGGVWRGVVGGWGGWVQKQRAPNGKNSPGYISQLRSGNHPQHLWLRIFSLDVSPTVNRTGPEVSLCTCPEQLCIATCAGLHLQGLEGRKEGGREKGRAEPLLVTPWAVDPVVGRRVAGPRGGGAWEERGGCHPCVGGGCTPSQYMVRGWPFKARLTRHVSSSLFPPCPLSHKSAPHFPRASPSGLHWASHL